MAGRLPLSLRMGLAVGVAAVPWLAASCGSSSAGAKAHPADATVDGPVDGSRDSSLDGGDGASDSGNSLSNDGPTTCTPGQICGDGGICTAGSCCPSAQACGGTCCGAGTLCSFGACVTPGAACFDTSDCPTGQYCQYSVVPASEADTGAPDASAAGCTGATLPSGVCLPAPPTCAADAGPDAACVESCQYHPEAGAFTPTLKYTWGGLDAGPGNPSDIMMAPVVLPLVDTNCDGKVDSEDIPDIVFTTFVNGAYTTNGTLHAVRVQGGALAQDWSVPSPIVIGGQSFVIDPAYQLAGGDLDGKPGAEIVACLVDKTDAGVTYGVAAFHPDGSLYWASAGPECFMPSIADLDQNGSPEVVTEGGILNGQTGAVTPYTDMSGATRTGIGYFAVSDIDGDGILDVVTGGNAYHASGAQFVATGGTNGFVAIGDLDKDGKPEIVTTESGFRISIWHYETSPPAPANYAWVQQHISASAASSSTVCASVGGGPPTIADFNGDGIPDVALAGSINYAVFDGSKLTQVDAGAPVDGSVPGQDFFLWTYYPTDDCSSAETGSTVFDFTGSGTAEVLYSDQQRLRVFNGPDGGVLWQTCNTTGTLQEYPLVVDVDNDGHADIVVVSNAYAIGDTDVACQDYDGGPMGESGLRVFSDANLTWVRTRALWNEHPYHITNVNDDGTIPAMELPNWTQPGLNNFRQNKAPGQEFAAPDAVVSLVPSCGGPLVLSATVRNIGQAALPAGVEVDFYAGVAPNGTDLGSTTTLVPLYSAQSEIVTFSNVPPAAQQAGAFYAVVNPPTAPPHPAWNECRTDNNTSAAVVVSQVCPSAQ